MKRRSSFVVDLTSHFDFIQLENGLFWMILWKAWPWRLCLSLSDYQKWTFGQVANSQFHSHLPHGTRSLTESDIVNVIQDIVRPDRSKIQRKKIQQLLVVVRLWIVSFRFPSQPIRSTRFVEFYLFHSVNTTLEFRFKIRSELLVETCLCSLTKAKHGVPQCHWTLSHNLGYLNLTSYGVSALEHPWINRKWYSKYTRSMLKWTAGSILECLLSPLRLTRSKTHSIILQMLVKQILRTLQKSSIL